MPYPTDPNYPYGPQVAPPQYLTSLQRNAPTYANVVATALGYVPVWGQIASAAIRAGSALQQHDTGRLVKNMAREAERYAREGREVKVEQDGGSGVGGALKRLAKGYGRLMIDTFGGPVDGGAPMPLVGGVYDAIKNPSETTGAPIYGGMHVVPQGEIPPQAGPGPAVARSQGMNPTSYGAGGPRMQPAPARPNMLMQHLQSQQAPQLGAGAPMTGGATGANGAMPVSPGAGGIGRPGGALSGPVTQGNPGGQSGRNTPLAPPLNAPYYNPGNTNTGGNNPVHRTFRGLLSQGIPDAEMARYYDQYTQGVNAGQNQINDYLARSGDASGYEGALQGGYQLGAAQAYPGIEHDFRQQQRAYLQDLIRMWRGTRKGGGGYVPNQPGSGFGDTLAGVGQLAQGVGAIYGAVKG